MWGALILAILFCLIILYLPGYFFTRIFVKDHLASFILAPALSVLSYVCLGVVFEKAAISCHAAFLLACSALLSLIVFLLYSDVLRTANCKKYMLFPFAGAKSVKTAALYILAAAIIAFLVFIIPMNSPESFARNDDTTAHLSYIRGFLDTKTYSTLKVSAYLNLGNEGGYYPAAWHILVAIVASVFGNNVALASNATLISAVVFLFPLGVFLLLQTIFSDRQEVVIVGALLPLAFCGFPWGFTTFGQLLPNMLAFMLIPSALAVLIKAIEAFLAHRKIALFVLILLHMAAIAVSQPNGVFTFGIWAVAYGVNRFFFTLTETHPTVRAGRIVGAVVLLVCACFIWVLFFNASFMQNIVHQSWSATHSLPGAIAYCLLFMFSAREGIHPFLSVVVLVGMAYSFKHKRYVWLVAAYIFVLVMAIIDVSYSGSEKQILTGFWYNDQTRIGAMVSLFAIPLAALGFSALVQWGKGFIERHFASLNSGKHSIQYATGILLMLFVFFEAVPITIVTSGQTEVSSGLVQTYRQHLLRYSWDWGLTDEEHEFIKEVITFVPEGSLIINNPRDGSCWSYGVDGLNTYYRRTNPNVGSVGAGGKEESELLSRELCNIATSQDIQSILKSKGAHYFLNLDDLSYGHETTFDIIYEPDVWWGIESITPNTPGFKLIMAEDDMYLYEIEY